MTRNVLLTIAYDGGAFHGWQIQPNQRTVQGTLEEALEKLCGERVQLHGTSRTDAGVHAFGQRATFSGEFKIPADRLPEAMNHQLPDIQIIAARDVPAGFHARHDAAGKTYLYRIQLSGEPDIFSRNLVWRLKETPNVGNMREAAKYIEGRQDFACFRAAGGNPRGSTVRTVYAVRIEESEQPSLRGVPCREIRIEITGNGFLYHMVRIIVGTLVKIGRGKQGPAEMKVIIASGDRAKAGPTAPAQGLYLREVYFSEREINERIRQA
ncbi:MAG: tRNA pseudouridine(38-40) synthase TruA [Clostridiales Family XIII bacterium]|jgi:tRNA pseudouridine38-40 synthase|nr:tRNA pseudouridine(38-40) synthase TruA [Clostridiales Family XIII bacterium]